MYSNLQFCHFKFSNELFGSSLLSVGHNLNSNFSLKQRQRDNILLVTFLNQSTTH